MLLRGVFVPLVTIVTALTSADPVISVLSDYAPGAFGNPFAFYARELADFPSLLVHRNVHSVSAWKQFLEKSGLRCVKTIPMLYYPLPPFLGNLVARLDPRHCVYPAFVCSIAMRVDIVVSGLIQLGISIPSISSQSATSRSSIQSSSSVMRCSPLLVLSHIGRPGRGWATGRPEVGGG